MSLVTTDIIKSLKKQSEAELDIFSNTVKRISAINSKIRIQKKKRNDQIAKLKTEVLMLQETEAKNEKTVSKIQSFLD